jgi:3alpha(or 20beta)-hydroxysteroid dehydrogenase
MGRLDGKVAIITGAARGQGAAEAALLASEGAQVVLTDVLDADGKASAAACGGTFIHHDVSSEESWRQAVGQAVAAHGRLDILVNNAGIFMSRFLTEMPLADFEKVIAINQTGVFLGMKIAGKAMIDAAHGGSIVNILSIAGMRGGAGSIAYSASKWAVRGMTKVAASELGRYGIRVNSIHPGAIDTPMLQQVPGIEGNRERTERRIPLGRIADPIDVARVVLFLASEDSSYMSGAELTVDGGWTG